VRAHLLGTTLEDVAMAYEEEKPSPSEEKTTEECNVIETESQQRD
jgi:hypothetical protein